MVQKLKKYLKNYNFSRENYSIIIVALFGLWVAWNSLFVIIKNNQLIEEINTRAEETAILELENENLELNIEYYKTDEFIEKAARRDLLLRAPGENVAIAPKTDKAIFEPATTLDQQQEDQKSNLQAWIDFFLGRKD